MFDDLIQGDMYSILSDNIFTIDPVTKANKGYLIVSTYLIVLYLGEESLSCYEWSDNYMSTDGTWDWEDRCENYMQFLWKGEFIYSFCKHELHVTPMQEWLDKGKKW